MAILMPQIADFQQKVDAIEQQFRTSFGAILTPDQKQKLDTITNGWRAFPILCRDALLEWAHLRLDGYLSSHFEHLSEDLALDDKQQHQLMDLLTERRNKLLALVDATPPRVSSFPTWSTRTRRSRRVRNLRRFSTSRT